MMVNIRSQWSNGKGQIPVRYMVADSFEAGRGPVADLLRASSLLAS